VKQDGDKCFAGNGNDVLIGGADDDKCENLKKGDAVCFCDEENGDCYVATKKSWEDAAKNAVEAKKALCGGGNGTKLKFHISCSD
jgi:hypothetical protein